MKKIWKKHVLNRYVALILAIVLVLSSVTTVRALDFMHSDENRHYLIYNDIDALTERIVNAYETSNYAVLGENVFLPLVDGNDVEEGAAYLIDILDKLAGKYLIDTVPVMENLTVYLTVDIDTLEFYLLVANNTASEHFVNLVFADGMEFEPFAVNYSFTLADEEIKEEVEEEIKEEAEEEIKEEVEEEIKEEAEEEIKEEVEEEVKKETGAIDEIEKDKEGILEQNPPITDDQNNPASDDGDDQQVEKDILEDNDPVIGIDPVEETNRIPNEINKNGMISEHQANNVSPNTKPANTDGSSNEDVDVNEDVGGDINEDIEENVNEGIEEDVNEEIDENVNEEIDENVTEDVDENVTEDVDENVTEDVDENVTEGVDENVNEDIEENVDDGVNEEIDEGIDNDVVEEIDDDGKEDSDENEEEKVEEEKEEVVGKVLIGMLLDELIMSKNTFSIVSTPSSATAVGFRYNASDYLPTISKTSVDNGDGTYTITLTVKGNNEIITKKTPINLVLALDVSNSMYWAMDDLSLQKNFDISTEPRHYRVNDPQKQSRWRILQNSINEIIDKVLTVNGSQISIVMYSGDNHNTNRNNWSNLNYSVLSDWNSNASNIKITYADKELWELTYGSGGQFYDFGGDKEGAGGTNGSAGFYASGLQFGKINRTANSNPNYLIYISDGIANRYISENGNSVSTTVPGYDNNSEAWFQQIALKTISFAQKVKSDYNAKIYTIGISGALDTVAGKRIGGYLMNPSTNKYQENYYTAATSSQLSDALTEISNSISGKKLSNLVVKDQLSKYVIYDGNLAYDGNNASIDENGLITWDVANELSKSESRQLSYKVRVNNAAAYQDANKLTPQADYVPTDNNLIGYYENEKVEEKYYFHSNEYAILEYSDINGDPSNMFFAHPVVKPTGKPYTLIINKTIQVGDEVPEDVLFDFLIKIKGIPYVGTVVTPRGELSVLDGKISLKTNEKAYLYVEGNKDGTLIPYEVTELLYVNERVISELVDVTVVQGNGTRSGNVVSGTIGNNASSSTKKYYYYTTTINGDNTKTYTWYSSNDGINDWVNTGIGETTSKSEPSIPSIFGSITSTSTKYYDSNNVVVASPKNLTLDYIEGERISSGTTIKVKDHSVGINFNYITQEKSKSYNKNNLYNYNYDEDDDDVKGFVPLSNILINYGRGYEKVGYQQYGKNNKDYYRKVIFYNPVVEKKIYEFTKATSEPKTTITELTFINSYMLVNGSITINKSINDYYSIHGNPVFLYRLDKMDGNSIKETYYDFIEFKMDESEYNSEFIMNGDEINSKTSDIATSVLFDGLTPGTYILTELQPIRYAFNKGIIENGIATIDNNGKATIVIKATNKDVELTYFNEKVNNDNFSHTDVVRNTFTVAQAPD